MDRFADTRQPDWDWWGRLWPTPGETLRALGLSAGGSVVDIGSGNGYFTLPAARIVDPAPVYALDVDTELLADVETLAERQGVENVVPVTGDARSLAEHLPEPVDIALIANTFHGIDNQPPFVHGTVDVLTEGGQFVVVNWQDRPRSETTVDGEPRGPPTDRRVSPTETRAVVQGASNLSLVGEVDLPPYHYALVFER